MFNHLNLFKPSANRLLMVVDLRTGINAALNPQEHSWQERIIGEIGRTIDWKAAAAYAWDLASRSNFSKPGKLTPRNLTNYLLTHCADQIIGMISLAQNDEPLTVLSGPPGSPIADGCTFHFDGKTIKYSDPKTPSGFRMLDRVFYGPDQNQAVHAFAGDVSILPWQDYGKTQTICPLLEKLMPESSERHQAIFMPRDIELLDEEIPGRNNPQVGLLRMVRENPHIFLIRIPCTLSELISTSNYLYHRVLGHPLPKSSRPSPSSLQTQSARPSY